MKLSNSKRFFLNIFSVVLAVYGLSALPPVLAAAFYGENQALIPLSIVSPVCFIAGVIIRHLCYLDVSAVHQRVNYMTVILSWLFTVTLSAVIFFFAADRISPAAALFEAAACLTATGTGNLGLAESPVSLQLWHSILNWLGGTGIILIAASFLPSWGFSGRSLVSVEFPGHGYLRSSSGFRRTYRQILMIYAAMTAAHFALLCSAGMAPFTSLLTSLSNVSTAGLQHIDHGTITALPLIQKIIISAFSLLGSVNISVFLYLFFSRPRTVKKNTETIVYIVRIILTGIVIALILTIAGTRSSGSTLADSLMQTVSFFSTSGYIVTDCGSWPVICQVLILLQVFIGGCAASTSGGIKTSRIITGIRTIRYGLFRHIHPQAVKPVRVDTEVLRTEQLIQANLFIPLFMFVYLAGALLLSADTKIESVYQALNFSQAMLTNTGTSVAEAGASVQLSPVSMIVMSVEMLCGRLEIYPVLMLFFRSFWSSESNR